MATIKTVADFKKNLAVGVKLACIYHLEFNGYDENNKPMCKDKDLGVREVTIKQSNSFALATPRPNGEVVNSWCNYPKASEVKIEDNKLTILTRDTREFKGGYAHESNPEYAALPMIPMLTYWFVKEGN